MIFLLPENLFYSILRIFRNSKNTEVYIFQQKIFRDLWLLMQIRWESF